MARKETWNTKRERHRTGMETEHLFCKQTCIFWPPSKNTNSVIPEDNSPLDFFCLFYNTEGLTYSK
jgi:hypothetical protein